MGMGQANLAGISSEFASNSLQKRKPLSQQKDVILNQALNTLITQNYLLSHQNSSIANQNILDVRPHASVGKQSMKRINQMSNQMQNNSAIYAADRSKNMEFQLSQAISKYKEVESKDSISKLVCGQKDSISKLNLDFSNPQSVQSLLPQQYQHTQASQSQQVYPGMLNVNPKQLGAQLRGTSNLMNTWSLPQPSGTQDPYIYQCGTDLCAQGASNETQVQYIELK